MLGFYTNFPRGIHKAETFLCSISNKKLQQALVETLGKLNKETLSLEEVAAPSIPECRVSFEFGVAEGNGFNFLDAEENGKLLKILNKKSFQIMDFLCIIRYQRMKNERKTHMRFDYYMLRLLFGERLIEMQVSHEKGLRHTSPDEIVKLVVDRINMSFSRKVLKPH